MRGTRTILVGVALHARRAEPTPGSRNACTQAARMAEPLGAEVVLLHSTWDGQRSATIEPGARDALETLRAELAADGTTCRLEVVPTRPWLAMCQAALDGGVDLVVVGKRDETTKEGRRLGNVAVKLLRKCPAPVWVVKPEHDLKHKLVLAASDLSAVGDHVVECAGFVAGAHSCALHVVHAWQPPASPPPAELSEEEHAARVDGIKSQAQSHLERVISAGGFDGESVVHLSRGLPALAIREAVEHLHPDLLVMGTVSRGGLAGFDVGTTAERLLDRVDCSILTVKPEDFVCPVQPPRGDGPGEAPPGL